MVKQVLLITEFCRKVQIPFKVFIFGQTINIENFDHYRPRPVVKKEEGEKKEQTHISNSLLGYGRDPDAVQEVLSSEMTTPEYRTMVGALLEQSFFNLGGTPTVNAMLNIEANINEFFLRHNVSIKKLFVITDGGAADGCPDMKSGYSRCFVSDPKTRKNYYIQLRGDHYEQTPVDVITKIYKDRYGIDTVFIALGHKKDVYKVVARRGYSNKKTGMAVSFGLIDEIDGAKLYHAHKKQNFLLMQTPLGVPVFFVKPTKAETEIEFTSVFRKGIWDPELRAYREKSVKEIAAEFAEGMASIKTSQTFLTILMQHVAVEME